MRRAELRWQREQVHELERLFDALGERTRLHLLKILQANPELCVGELATKLGIGSSAASQHCRQLQEAGLLRRERHGQKVSYQISPATVEARAALNIVKREEV